MYAFRDKSSCKAMARIATPSTQPEAWKSALLLACWLRWQLALSSSAFAALALGFWHSAPSSHVLLPELESSEGEKALTFRLSGYRQHNTVLLVA